MRSSRHNRGGKERLQLVKKGRVIVSDKKPILISFEPHVLERLNALLKHSENNGNKISKPKFFAELVNREWTEKLGNYKIEIDDHTIYFDSEEKKEKTETLLKGYVQSGMQVDQQLISYICEQSQAYAVKREI